MKKEAKIKSERKSEKLISFFCLGGGSIGYLTARRLVFSEFKYVRRVIKKMLGQRKSAVYTALGNANYVKI